MDGPERTPGGATLEYRGVSNDVLSGTFFPRFLMPEWLQNLSGLLPLTPVIDGIRLIATEGKHLGNHAANWLYYRYLARRDIRDCVPCLRWE